MRLTLVDENLLLIDALKNLLLLMPEFTEISTYTSGKDFLNEAGDVSPDVLVLDLASGVMEGNDLLEACKHHFPESLRIVVLSEINDVSSIKLTIKRGAHGILSKQTTFEELKECIFTVNAGSQYIGKSLKDSLINSVFSDEPNSLHLSPREREVLQRVCGGHTIKEIAYDLKLSVHTVQYYHRSVMDKLKVKRTTDLIVYAIQHKLYIPEAK